jgi:uncharacterized membrane protein YkoI
MVELSGSDVNESAENSQMPVTAGSGIIWNAGHRPGSKVISNSNLPRRCSALHSGKTTALRQMTGLSCAVQRPFISILFNGMSEFSKQQNRTIMKIKMIVCSALAAFLLAGCATENQAKLMAAAKVSKETAQQTALAKVPNGTVKAAEIEKEKGKLQWSFDVATPDSKDITEVNVDAMTGDVISVEKESAQTEAKEKD